MTISKLGEDRVLLVLGDRDMDELALDFAVMSMENAHSRRVILRLTALACRKSGIDISGKRLSIEAMQMTDCCYILVTVGNEPRRYRLKRIRRGGGCCWRFEDCAAFLGAVEALYRRGLLKTRNAAYEKGGAYYLIFERFRLPEQTRGALSEFGEYVGGALCCAHIREHGRALCAHNAVSSIGRFL